MDTVPQGREVTIGRGEKEASDLGVLAEGSVGVGLQELVEPGR